MKRIVIANFYSTWPAVGGGQRRIFYLARELSKQFDVELIVPDRNGRNETVVFGPNLREIRVAVEGRFRELEIKLDAEVQMAADVAYALHWDECALYNEVLAKRLAVSDACVTAHPYSIYALLQARGDTGIPIVFDSQNVELQQKSSVLERFPHLLEAVRDVEETALLKSQHAIACTPNDATTFAKEYGVDADQITIIENGVDALGVPHVPEDALTQIRTRLGLKDQLTAVFGGSFHHPNFSAADRILDFAKQIPDMQFIVLGGVCNYGPLRDTTLENVIRLGEVDETTKWMAFRVADIGLNPMDLGSGSNIKMFEYAAAELAVVSSPFGARGLGLKEESEFIVCALDEMRETLSALTIEDRARLADIGVAARQSVTRTADWSVIGKRYSACFSALTS